MTELAQKRSANMAKIGSKNTKPELLLRSALFKLGYRYTLHAKKMPGKPDLVFPKYNTVVFVHGCFWHQHKSCREGRVPNTRQEYWIPKLMRNIERDELNATEITRLGWKVVTVWECEIETNLGRVVSDVENSLKADR